MARAAVMAAASTFSFRRFIFIFAMPAFPRLRHCLQREWRGAGCRALSARPPVTVLCILNLADIGQLHAAPLYTALRYAVSRAGTLIRS